MSFEISPIDRTFDEPYKKTALQNCIKISVTPSLEYLNFVSSHEEK